MGFQPWVPQQESNWEIRVVVLLSLILQVVLIFLGPTRKYTTGWLPRFAVWSCYLLADWVADLALGLLLNNMGVIGGDGSSSPVIFAFWTPFLLLHLGGPDTITAYSLEDNELWLRHLIGLLFELSSVIVIFGCSVRGNPMILATVLILVAGVIKYGERTYSLYRGSTKGFDSSNNIPGSSRNPLGMLRLDLSSYGSIEARAYYLFWLLRPLFVEMTIGWDTIRVVKNFFRGLKPSEAFEMIELELNFMYDMMYTKAAVAHTRVGWVLRFICSCCIVSALAIFFFHDKGGMKHIDVGITYALLLGALALDMAAMAMLLFSDCAAVFLQELRWFNWLGRLTSAARRVWQPRSWSETTSQLNLISDCLDMPQYHSTGWCWFVIAKLRSVAEKLRDSIVIRQAEVPLNELRDFIFHGAKVDEDECARNRDKLIEVCYSRGERVLERFKHDIKGTAREFEDYLMNSVKNSDFDASLLMWHIATDICLLDDDDGEEGQLTKRRRLVSKTLSEYLLYLLVKQSEMVSAKAGVWLSRYQDTRDHLKKEILRTSRYNNLQESGVHSQVARYNNLDHNGVRRRLLQERISGVSGEMSVLRDAIRMAFVLSRLGGELRWELVSGVWMEMLTYTATKCRATTHVRRLNRGSELITLVWLLREQMGLGELELVVSKAI